jgi:hypothetical protein
MAALVGVALVSAAGLAQAETRFAVQDPTGTMDKMVVTDKGFVGVGTTPGYPIHVTVPFGAAMYFQSTGRPLGTASDSANLYLMRNNDATINGGLPRVSDRLGMLQFGSLVTGVGNVTSAGISSYAETGNWTATSAPTNMIFFTTPSNSTGAQERIRISSTGLVGVGTNAPTQRLEVNGGLRLKTTAARPACDGNVRGTFWFVQGGTGAADTLEVCAKDTAGNFNWKPVM